MARETKFVSGDQNLYDRYTLKKERVIGRGNSLVFEVEDEHGNIECVKEMRLEDKTSEFIYRKQIEFLGKLKNHPHINIVEFKGSYCVKDVSQAKKKKGYIQMEKGITNLKQFIQHRKDRLQYFQQEEVLNFVTTMIDAFTHLQKIQLAHRDVKPSNILIFSQNPLFMKICDVGAGTAVGISDATQNRTVTGTPYYLSPELFTAFKKKSHETTYKVYKSDCYSLGLVFLEFCTLKRIQERLVNEKEVIEQEIRQIKKRYPNIVGLGKVLRRMLDENIRTRYDFLQLQQYINENDLLRSKINSQIKLDPELLKKLTSSRELVIRSFEDLSILPKIISSGNKAPIVRIHLATKDGTLRKNEQEMLEQLKNIRHIYLEQLDLRVQMCEMGQKQAQIIAYGIHKNINLRKISLHLWNNQIKTEGSIKIISSIQTVIENLQFICLYLPSNAIRINEKFEDLFNFVNAKKLHELKLNFGFNDVSPDFFVTLIKGISMAQNLRNLELIFEKTKLNHVLFSKGIKELQNLKKLSSLFLNFSDNPIRDEGMFGLCDLLSNLTELKQLILVFRNAEIGDKGFYQLTKSLMNNEKLQTLKINAICNELTEKFKIESLEKNKNLRHININLSNNKIDQSGLKSIQAGLNLLQNLHHLKLNLDGTRINQKGFKYFAKLISKLPYLSQIELSVRHNHVSIQSVKFLCTGLNSLKRLKKLKLIFEGTRIGDEAALLIAKCLLKIKTLTSVDLNMENCDLGQQTMKSITKTVKQYSDKTEQITISMRKNKQIKMQLYQQIKKELNNSRIAVKVDQPLNSLEYSQTS